MLGTTELEPAASAVQFSRDRLYSNLQERGDSQKYPKAVADIPICGLGICFPLQPSRSSLSEFVLLLASLDNLRLARHTPRMTAKCGDHCLQ
jgi:hypothetical protein